jgi:hypothetical protein
LALRAASNIVFIQLGIGCDWRKITLSYFREAKAHFVASHQHPVNIALHHWANILAIAAIILLFYDWRWTLFCLVLTQVFALGGHAFIEKNQPAAVKYPGITILASLSWSFENWFGIRQIWQNFKNKAA